MYTISRQLRGLGSVLEMLSCRAAGVCGVSTAASSARHHELATSSCWRPPSSRSGFQHATQSPLPHTQRTHSALLSTIANGDSHKSGFETGIVKGAHVKFNDSAALRLRRRAYLLWEDGKPNKVLIVKKPRNAAATQKLLEIGTWLQKRGLQVYVEKGVRANETPQFDEFDSRAGIDFCITLGGDGTVLYLASLFGHDEPLPPLMSFAMGTLGFLTPFDAADFEACLTRVLNAATHPLFCTLRTRKRCEVHHNGTLQRVHHVLNEFVIDRGACPGAVYLDLIIDGTFVSTCQADGLIIATPSGSTAYSMSAGGPMVAPSVPCTLLTPIAPLSLSFRPLIIPESSSIVIYLPLYSRSHARASFDGKYPMRVQRGSSVHLTTSLWPLPIINLGSLDSDWYEGITQKLKWNQTIREPPPQLSAANEASMYDSDAGLVDEYIFNSN